MSANDDPVSIGGGLPPMPTQKEEWITRCAKRYIERAGMPVENAFEAARVNYDETAGLGLNILPEDAADDDMGCWTDDGDES